MVVFDGLPLHPLIVHAPVVLLPLVAVGLGLVLARPSLRPTLAPVVAVLAIGAAVTAIGAVWSGEELGDALGRGDELDAHEAWGELTRTFAVLVAIGATAFAAVERFLPERPGIMRILGVVTTGVAIAAGGVVGVAGHAGATLAWEGRVPSAGAADAGGTGGAGADGGAGPVVADDEASAGGDGQASQPAEEPLPASGIPGVDVVLGEWALVPSTEVAPPGTITFRFRNLGTVPHALRIRTPGSGGDRREWRSETVGPGETGVLVAELSPGTYELDCPVEDGFGEHDELGMETRFSVRGGAAPLEALPDGIDGPVAGPDEPPADAQRAAPPEASGPRTIDIRSFAYEPADLQLPVGTEVTWINRDPAPHTATGDGFDTGRLEQDASASITFTETGTFDYLCTIHPAMRGRVTIIEP